MNDIMSSLRIKRINIMTRFMVETKVVLALFKGSHRQAKDKMGSRSDVIPSV